MAFKIGFSVSEEKERCPLRCSGRSSEEHEPRRSVCAWPAVNMTLAYYNDRFDLHCGDLRRRRQARGSAGASWMSTTTSASIWRTISA